MKNKVSITELARMRGVTTETLRHYDRIGLLKPDSVDEDTGYRYYSLAQIEIFDTIIDLKNMGLSLKAIQEFMNSRNIDKTYLFLKEKEKEIQDEIEEKSRQLLHFQERIEFINLSKNLKGEDSEWKIKNFPNRKLIISKEIHRDIYEFFYEFTRLRSNLADDNEIFATDLTGSVINKDSFLNEKVRFQRYPAIPRGMCKDIIEYGEEYILNEAKYLCCYGRGMLRPGATIVKKVKKYLNENNLIIIGDIYEKSLIDTSMTDIEEEKIYRLEIPVEKFE